MVENSIIILFGATGDLVKRKIIPALYHLFKKEKLGDDSIIVCLGRRPLDKEQFVSHLQMPSFVNRDIDTGFLSLIEYVSIAMDMDEGAFSHRLERLVRGRNITWVNTLCYLALPEELFGDAVRLVRPLQKKSGWLRVVFEKPFGRDLKSAVKLNSVISHVLDEEQVFRVDHYLGKELVQNVMTLRFRNELFRWAWHKDAIDHIQITASEQLGVENRAGYYDRYGAVKDMIQNHLLQLLSLVAMEPPSTYDADCIRDEAARVMQYLRYPESDDIVLGQYGRAEDASMNLQAYLEEAGVRENSTTETFAALRLYVDNSRWMGVPFYLKTGKRLKERYADIKIIFKQHQYGEMTSDKPNMITIRIQPDEGMASVFNVRDPGEGGRTVPVLMDFCHHCLFGPNTPEAYESILYSVLHGDKAYFPRWDWLEGSWKYIDRVYATAKRPVVYESGSTGPKESELLLANDGRSWLHGEITPRRVVSTILPIKKETY